MRQEAFIWDRVSKRSFTIHLIVIVGLFYNCIYLLVSNIVIIISILLLQMCCFGNPNMVTQIVSKLRTTYWLTPSKLIPDSLDTNTKQIRNAMLDQVVWKDFVNRKAQDDSQLKLVNKCKRCHRKKVTKRNRNLLGNIDSLTILKHFCTVVGYVTSTWYHLSRAKVNWLP